MGEDSRYRGGSGLVVLCGVGQPRRYIRHNALIMEHIGGNGSGKTDSGGPIIANSAEPYTAI